MGSSSSKTDSKEKEKKKSSSTIPISPILLAWSSPHRFSQLYDPVTKQIVLPLNDPALIPSTSTSTSSSSQPLLTLPRRITLTRDHLSELFFELSTSTQWQQQQVRGLFSVYKSLCLMDEEEKYVLTLATFTKHFFPPSSHTHFPTRVIQRLFTKVFDTDSQDGLISFPEFVKGISTCVHGDRKTRQKVVFDMFCSSGSAGGSKSSTPPLPSTTTAAPSTTTTDPVWSSSDLSTFLRAAMMYIKPLARATMEEVEMRSMLREDEWQWWHTEVEKVRDGMKSEQAAAVAATTAAATAGQTQDVTAAKIDLADAISPAGAASVSSSTRSLTPSSSTVQPSSSTTATSTPAVTFTSFRAWSRRYFRVRAFLSRFSVLPTPSAEAQRIAALWNDDAPLQVGETYYVLSEQWWRSWKKYTGFKEPGEDDTANGTAAKEVGANEKQDGEHLESTTQQPTPTAHAATEAAAYPSYLVSDTESDEEDRAVPASRRSLQQSPANSSAAATAAPPTTEDTAKPQRPTAQTQSSSTTPQRNRAASSHELSAVPQVAPPLPERIAPTLVKAVVTREDETEDGEIRNDQATNGNVANIAIQVHPAEPATPSSTPAMIAPTPNGTHHRLSITTPHTNTVFPTHSPSPSPAPSNTRNKLALAALAALRPTAIDNSDLSSPKNPLLLRQPLVEHDDFLLVNSEVWNQLQEWYGVISSATIYPRHVIEVVRAESKLKRVELYPLCVRVQYTAKEAPKVSSLPKQGIPIEGVFILLQDSSNTTVAQLEQKMLEMFYTPEELMKLKEKELKLEQKREAKKKELAMLTSKDEKNQNQKQQNSSSSTSTSSTGSTVIVNVSPSPTSTPSSSSLSTTPSSSTTPSGPPSASRPLRMWIRDGNDWRCLSYADDFDKTLEAIELQQEEVLLVELPKKKSSSSSSSSSSPSSWYMDKRTIPRPWTQFTIGDTLDAKDKQAIWYASVIKGISTTKDADGKEIQVLFIHFIEWDEKWNENIPASAICRCRAQCTCTGGRLAAANAQVRFKKSESSNTTSSGNNHSNQQQANTPLQRGLCGLQNLGNTCFMNSTLQCLSNTPYFISNYILTGKYQSELNKSNPLGHKGQLATDFANLIKDLWSGQYRYVAPIKFKRSISDFAPQFEGYQQQDSQELLAFLLDGVHEDLNRVLKKVPTKAVDSNGRPDAVVVREAWTTYKIRNQSIVVDLFMGMLKSTVICPASDCARVSVSFDPFRYLSLPLPMFTDRQFVVTYCSMTNPSTPLTNYGIILPEHASVAQLRDKLSELTGVPIYKLLICDVHKAKLYRVLMDTKRVSTIRETDVLFAYEILPEAFTDVAATPAQAQVPVGGSTSTVTTVNGNESQNSQSSTSSSSSSSSSSSTAPSSPSAACSGQLRSNLVYLQAIHKYILTDSRGVQGMSLHRFGVPVCYTTTQALTNMRLHQIINTGVERWLPKLQPKENGEPQDLPYSIRMMDHTCSRCGVCPESSNCGGCCLPYNTQPCNLDSNYALCILWDNPEIAQAAKTLMDVRYDHVSMRQRVRNDQSVTLYECMELFGTKETLSKDDAYYCSGCKEFRQATKQLQLYHAPEILIIHLKRFIQINRIRREKQSTLVDFPIKGLDLAPYIPQHALENEAYPMYDLYAISNHSGNLSGGHYTSFCLNPDNKRWYLFDDSRISEVSVNQIKTCYSYVLFYKRRG